MKGPDIIVSRVVAAPLETVWESWADFGDCVSLLVSSQHTLFVRLDTIDIFCG